MTQIIIDLIASSFVTKILVIDIVAFLSNSKKKLCNLRARQKRFIHTITKVVFSGRLFYIKWLSP